MCHLYNLFLLVELILLRLERMFLQLGLLGTSGTVRTSLPLGEKKKKKKHPIITPEIQRYVEGFF